MRLHKPTLAWLLALALLAGCAEYQSDDGTRDNPLDPDNPDAINHPPDAPATPTPSNGATGVSLQATLGWIASDPDGDTLVYDLHFGTSSSPPKVSSEQSGRSYQPEGLTNSTTYYWRVVAIDSFDFSASSPEWSFTTAGSGNQPPLPPAVIAPSDGAEQVSTEPALSWAGSDPENDALSYTVFFGSESDPPVAVQDVSVQSYSPGTLQSQTTYYWRVEATDIGDKTTSGPVWSFTTYSDDDPAPTTPSLPSPSNGMTSVPVPFTLEWSSNDPAGGPVEFSLYLGNSNPPGLVASGVQDSLFAAPKNLFATSYYWRVVAHDSDGDSTSGPVWLFQTEDNSGANPFDPVADTGQPYTIVVDAVSIEGSSGLSPGDIVAVMDGELCVGIEVQGASSPLTLTAWEGDSDNSLPGYTAGNPMSFLVWDASENALYRAQASFSQGDGSFGSLPYSVVSLIATP